MQKVFENLDQHIRENRPLFYSHLNPGLTEAQIIELESKFKREIPTDLQLLYQWRNGQNPEVHESFINNSTFLPLERALDTAQELTDMIGFDFDVENWWNESWIPIFTNGGGDHICYDIIGVFSGRPGQLVEFWHSDNDRNILSPSLETLLQQLICFYETTDHDQYDGHFQVGGAPGFPQCFTVE